MTSILAWVDREFFDSVKHPTLRPALKRYLRLLKVNLHTRGFQGAISFAKERRQGFYQFMASPKEIQDRMILGRFGRFWGAPFLMEVQKFKGDNPESVFLLRMALTVLSATRSASLPTRIDVGSIANGLDFSQPAQYGAFLETLESFGTFCETFWHQMGVGECAWADPPDPDGDRDDGS